MTFLEAAIEVLKREGKPLSTKQLAQIALKHNLLSVVGRDPEGTMEQRLHDAMEKNGDKTALMVVRQGVYGLREYPPQPYPAGATNGEVVAAPAAGATAPAGEGAGDEKPEGERKRRRRGRRGGRGKRGAEAGAVEAEPVEEAAGEVADETVDEAVVETVVETGANGAEPAGEEKRGRRRSRRGGRGRRGGEKKPAEGETQAVTLTEAVEAIEAVEAVDAVEAAPEEAEEPTEAAPSPDSELLMDENAAEGESEEFNLPSGPLLAPSMGAEESTRGEEDRTLRPEIQGRRISEDRPRHGRGGRDRGRHGERDRQHRDRPNAPPMQARDVAPAPQQSQHPQQPRPQATVSAGGGVIDAALEALRSSDGRPMHVRQLADVALKRNLVDVKLAHPEIVRLLRAALVREARDREADGLRARVRALGGGHYALADRKLDQELVPLERSLADSAARLREATLHAVRRRVQRLSPPAFEALGRALLDKLGFTGVELVRRGEGVAYYGGQKQLGVANLKTLIAMRPGEGEIHRRAVGELRAGLAARGYDEGLLLAGGRAAPEGLAELKAGTGVVVHDGQSFAALCISKGLGVRRVNLPVDYLDLELFSELTEG